MKAEIDTLGTTTFIIGPSNGHNLWLPEWQEAYPQARLFISAGIAKKLTLKNYQILDGAFDNIWHADLKHVYLQGAPLFNESIFLHQATNSLLVTDLIQNYSALRPPGIPGLITRFIIEPMGFKGTCVAPPLKWGFAIKDQKSLSAVISIISAWKFERIIVTHGDIIEADARQVFTDLCSRFLL